MLVLTYTAIAVAAGFSLLSVMAWRRYTWVAEHASGEEDRCQYSLTEVFGGDHLMNVPHQKGVRRLGEVFGRSVV